MAKFRSPGIWMLFVKLLLRVEVLYLHRDGQRASSGLSSDGTRGQAQSVK